MNHPDKPEQFYDELDDCNDEDYGDYLTRCADYWSEHPPAAPPGFDLVPCEHEPRHWPEYTVTDNDFYPRNCSTCAYIALAERHYPCEHSHHRAWRRWRVSRRVLSTLYRLRLAKGYGYTHSAYCNGCLTSITLGRREKSPW